jgi:hypothetical protein
MPKGGLMQPPLRFFPDSFLSAADATNRFRVSVPKNERHVLDIFYTIIVVRGQVWLIVKVDWSTSASLCNFGTHL